MPVLLENEMTEGEIAAANVYGGGRWLVGRSANDNGWHNADGITVITLKLHMKTSAI